MAKDGTEIVEQARKHLANLNKETGANVQQDLGQYWANYGAGPGGTQVQTLMQQLAGSAPPSKGRSETEYQQLNTQKKKEESFERVDINPAQIKRDRAKQDYETYMASDEKRQRDAERNRKAKQDQIIQSIVDSINGNPGGTQVPIAPDEKEQTLLEAMRQAEEEYAIETDLEAITGLSNEERQMLEQYAVNQIGDQNRDVDMVGVLPNAQQQAAPLIQKYGQQRVNELAETYMRQQNAELARQVEAQSREFADKHGVIGSALTVPVAALGGVVGTVGQLQGMARGTGRYRTLDPNATGTIGDTFTGAVRGQVAQNIVDELGGGFLGNAASVGYQGLMSAADSIARAFLGGGAAGGAALAATGSFSQVMADASRRGATPAQAALMATATAGIEALSEKIPLDNLIRNAKGSRQTVMQVIGNALAQAGIEATTEEISLLGTLLADAAIMQDKSSYQLFITSKIMQGISPAQARDMANQELVDEALNTALVSMASGGMSSLGGSYANARGLFAQEQAQNNPVLNKPKNAQQTADEAIENNRARRERMAAEQTVQEQAQPQTEVQAPQPTHGEVIQNTMANAVRNARQGQQTQSEAIREALQRAPETPMTEAEDASYQQERAESLDDQNAPPPQEKYSGETTGDVPGDPFAGRDWYEVGKRNVKAYMYENPEVKPFFQAEAQNMLMELADTQRGERFFNEDVYYQSGGEKGYSGVKRNTSDDIAYLLDTAGFTYDQIEKGLKAIIQDEGAENNAVSKRIEFVLNDRLMQGHNDFYSNERVPASQEYIDLINEKQITQYSRESFDALLREGDRYASPESAPSMDTQMGANNQSTEGGQIKGTGAAESNFSGKPVYNATLSEDNAQPDRRDDVRPMELPERDINDNPISATTANVYASQNTPDDLADAMEEPVARGDYSYVRITNDAATERARQEIGRARDWETARANFGKDVEKGIAGAEISARGALILNHAAEVYQQAKDSGNPQAAAKAKKEWLGVLSDVQKLGTNTAQGLQALRIIRNLAPQDKIQFAQIAVQNMVRDMRLNTDIQIDEQLLTEYEAVTTDQQRDKIMERIQQNVADQIPSTILDKWNALRYTNMLGNLKTTGRNIAGNVANTAVYRLKDATGAAIEAIANKVSGGKVGRTKSVIVNKQLQKAMGTYYRQVKGIISSGGKYGENNSASGDFMQGVMDKRRIFKGPLMEGYRKATNWMMNNERFGDEAFGKAAFTRSMAGYLQANGIKTEADIKQASPELIEKAMAHAVKEAQEATFHDNSALANVLGKLKKATGVVGEGVMPFTKTPANVLTRAEEFSPLGILNTAILSAQKAAGNTKLANKNGVLGQWAARGQDITGTDIINSLSKTLTGYGLFALGAILQSQGFLNGGPDDDDEQASFDKMNGFQPYSINMPDGTTYTLDWLTPVAMPLFMGAQFMDIASNKDLSFADLEQVFTSIADPMLQMSMMQGINDSLDSIKDSENNLGQFFMNAAVNYLTQGLTNTLLGQLERSTEENRQTTYIDKDSNVPEWMQKQLGKASQKIPFWDYQQMDYRNSWGETQKNEGGLLYNLLSPGYSSKTRTDAVTNELNRVRETTGESVFPSYIPTTITYTDSSGDVHKDYQLSEEEYQAIAQTQGQTARTILDTMIKSKNYAAMTDEQKAKAMQKVYTYAREKALVDNIKDHTGYSESWMMEMKGNTAAEQIISRVAGNSLNSAMETLTTAWDNGYKTESLMRELDEAYTSYQKMTGREKAEVREFATGTASTYLQARDGGISHEKAVNTIKQVKAAGTLQKDKMSTIAKQPALSEDQKVLMGKLYGSDAQDENIDQVKAMGYTFADYTKLYRDHQDYTKGYGKKNRTINKWMQDYGIDYATGKKLYEIFS